jgi:hypothetical protein
MKPADKLLLHSIDAASPGGLQNRRREIVLWIIRAATYIALFVAGFVFAVCMFPSVPQ